MIHNLLVYEYNHFLPASLSLLLSSASALSLFLASALTLSLSNPVTVSLCSLVNTFPLTKTIASSPVAAIAAYMIHIGLIASANAARTAVRCISGKRAM